ncbi:MAG: HAD-IA family hydrolase [Saprospiraceae bacterium]
MKTKVAFLDLGGVVFNSTGQSNEKIDWTTITELNYKYGYQLNIGEDLFPDFMKDYNQMTQQKMEGAEFLKLVFDTLKFNQELVDLLSVDHRIIIVSDNYRENIEYISQRYHFSDWADQEFYSFDFKMHKAEPIFFKLLLEKVNVDLENLIFIDDSPKKLQSARQHGIKGILFKNNQQVKNALKG